MKHFTLCLIVCLTFFLLVNAIGYDVGSIGKPAQYLYVRDKTTNLRDVPKGTKINQLLQKTKVKVVEKKGNWVKATVEGWIEEKSLTDDLSSIADETSAGNGFYYKNVSFKSDRRYQVLGEVTNKSNKNYQTVQFILSVYDSHEKLLGIANIFVDNIPKGVTKSFKASLRDVQMSKVSSYKIQFEAGY